MNTEIFRKEKYSNSKNFVSRTLSDTFPQIALKFATLNLFYPFLFVSLYKIPFEKLIVCVIFRISIRTRKLWNLPFEFTV